VSTLPAKELLSILESDDLKVTEESIVVKVVEGYIALREPIRPLLEEEDPAFDPKVVAQLTEEEKKAREDARASKVAEAKAAADEAAAKEAEEVDALDDLGKI
jgi:hypothetical protein